MPAIVDLLLLWPAFAEGLLGTVYLTAVSGLLGIALAMGIATLRAIFPRHARRVIAIYVEAIRNTPFLVQLFLLYFGLASIGIRLSPGVAAILALSINVSAYMAEIVRAGFEAVPRGQFEAGAALGLRPLQVYPLIVFRPMLKATFPSLVSQMVLLLLTSSLVSAVSATDLASTASQLNLTTFRSMEIYGLTTLLYLALVVLLRRCAATLYRRYIDFPTDAK